MNTNQLMAGTASVDITPPLGTRINGDFIAHYATSIHDHLYVKSVALKSGDTTIVFVVVDTCYMQADFLNPLRKEISKRTGLPESNFLFCCTHTHSAGAIADLLLGAADIAYTKKLPEKIIACVEASLANMQSAKIAFGAVDVPEHILCRRYFMKDGYQGINPVSGEEENVVTNPFGFEEYIKSPVSEMDAQLSFLAIKSMDDKWISIIANYSLHYVGDFDPGIISADYFGEFAHQMKSLLNAGDDFTGIMTNGTSGEANIWDFSKTKIYPEGSFEKSKFIAKELSVKLVSSLSEMVWQNQPNIKVAYKDLYLTVNKPGAEELDEAEKILKESIFESIKIINHDTLKSIYAREQFLLASENDQQQLTVQALRIGDGVIGALAGEFFAETGLWLKEQKLSKHYFTIGLANGCVGYVPPVKEIDHGGYETWRCRTSKLQKDAESIVRNELLQLIKKVAIN